MATEINSTLKQGFEQINKDIEQFDAVFPITEDMHITYSGVARLVILDHYSFKDT